MPAREGEPSGIRIGKNLPEDPERRRRALGPRMTEALRERAGEMRAGREGRILAGLGGYDPEEQKLLREDRERRELGPD